LDTARGTLVTQVKRKVATRYESAAESRNANGRGAEPEKDNVHRKSTVDKPQPILTDRGKENTVKSDPLKSTGEKVLRGSTTSTHKNKHTT